MSTGVDAPQRIWTETELQALPEDGFIHEVVNGELVMSPKKNFQHENIFDRLYPAISAFNRQHKLGAVRGSSAGYWMNNRNCRAPDISFIPKARLQALDFSPNSRRFFPGAPDLAIEILSPGNSRSEMDARIQDFFSSGTQLVWIINPDTESVEVCHSVIRRALIGPGGFLDGENLLPGFRFPIADLFKEWHWE